MLSGVHDELAREVLKSAHLVIQQKTGCSGLDLVNLFMRMAGVLAVQQGVQSAEFEKEAAIALGAVRSVEAVWKKVRDG